MKENIHVEFAVHRNRCFGFESCIALGYRLDDWVVQDLAGDGNFSLHHHVETGSGDHPVSYPMGTRGSFLRIMLLGHEANHSPPSSDKVKNVWSYTSTPPTLLHGVVFS
jgi:hypothetical protein